jgi:hypothetical protein
MLRIAIIFFTLGVFQSAFAQIYKTNLNGQTYYGNKPYGSSLKTSTFSHSKGGTVKKIAYLYKYLDPQGGYHYTDEPRGGYQLLSKTKVEVHYQNEEGKPSSSFHKFSGTPVFTSSNYNYTSPEKSQFNDLITEVAARYQVDERLVHAVIQTESAYNAKAVSPAGAVGLMQLMPGTAERYGVADRRDPVQNIHGGTRYLRDLLDMFRPNVDLAIAAYNAGENAVLKYNYTIPPYSETQNYVRQVLARYNH